MTENNIFSNTSPLKNSSEKITIEEIIPTINTNSFFMRKVPSISTKKNQREKQGALI